MTTSSVTSPVTRETSAYVRDKGYRALIVTITGSLIELRCKGLKSRETVSIADLYEQAIKARVRSEMAAKKLARKNRRSA